MAISVNASRAKVYIIIFMVVVFFYVIVLYRSYNVDKDKETFVSGDGAYTTRLTVIDVFDSYLKRNPTPSEIDKYSKLKNEQDILEAVMKDFKEPSNIDTKNAAYVAQEQSVIDEEEEIVEEEKEKEKQVEDYTDDTITVSRKTILDFKEKLQNAITILDMVV